MGAINEQESVAIFPDGTSIEDYAECRSWSFHRWAWEFLRRNTKFQDACKTMATNPTPSDKLEIKDKFGLVRFKHYTDAYGATKKERPKFKTADVVCWPRVSEKIFRKIKANFPKDLKPGQVLVRFDLNNVPVTPSSIKAMLGATEIYLKSAAKIWSKEQGKTTGNRRNREDLLPLLRLLDLDHNRAITKVSRQQMAEMVYGSGEKQFGDPGRVISKKLTTAKRYRDSGYLHLAASEERARKADKK
jgi:hypothetical protein